jgi:hypothetical protein
LNAIRSGAAWRRSTRSRILCRRGKTSLDGICDALDQGGCGPEILSFVDRRNEEDTLSATVYSNLPYPENQLVSLTHSLVARGVIDETELQERLASIRARLEAR